MIGFTESEGFFPIGPAGRLFLLGFLKILALLMAFFFLDKERREPRHKTSPKHHFSRWLQWPIVLSLAVACGTEGYDAYLKYTDDKESAAKTDRLLQSIERRSRPLFPMRIHGLYTLDLSGQAFGPLRAIKSKLVQGDSVDEEALSRAIPKLLDPQTAEVFHTAIDSDLFFLKDRKDLGISWFNSDASEKAIELTVPFATKTSCGAGDRSPTVRAACEWPKDLLEIPVDTQPIERFAGTTYVHGGIQFYPDLAGSAVIVRSCLELPDDSPQPQLVRELKRTIGLRYVSLTIAGGDSFTLKNFVEHQYLGNCDYAMYRFGRTIPLLDAQLDAQ